MANPSVLNGHIDIANELAERFAHCSLSGQEWRIIWVVLRQTWGWKNGDKKKNFDWISLSQFEEKTGMKRANVSACLKELVVKRLLLKQENGYGINQNYDQWVVVKRLPPVVKRLPGSSQLTTKNGSQTTTNNRKKDTLTKDSSVRPETISFFEWLSVRCEELHIDNQTKLRTLDVFVNRYLGKIHFRPEMDHYLAWMIDNNKRVLRSSAVGNCFKRQASYQKKQELLQMERKQANSNPHLAQQMKARGEKPLEEDPKFVIDPAVKARLNSMLHQ